MVRSGAVVQWLSLYVGSNPASGVSEIGDGENLCQWSGLEIRLNEFRRSTIPQKQFMIIIITKRRNELYDVGPIWP